MLSRIRLFILLFFGLIGFDQLIAQSDYAIRPVPFSEVQLKDAFWSEKIRTNHEVTIPIAYQKSLETGRIDNFKIAGGLMAGQFCTEYPFDDTDIYKIIEAASYSIQTYPDKAMEAMMDSLIYLIGKAQEPDGYLYTTRTIGKNLHPWAGEARWQLVNDLSHELYNLGHLYEAAAAHYTATGKRSLLDIAIKSADLIDREFGEGRRLDYPGHQEVEIGLVKLYRITGEERYLRLAKFFLDIRGREGVGEPKAYNQSHEPVIRQSKAVGHAVRGAYMWTAMADVAAMTGDASYLQAINRIWHDVVGGKYYINGGIGATNSGEAFGDAYELPNMSAYCETCAGVGNATWNHRMFLMTGKSQYIDVLERTMYNNILDGVSLSGDHFFYPNPLQSYGQHQRSEWFGCACCPPNVARFLPSMPGYIYAQREDNIYVNLYISSASTFDLKKGDLTLEQESGFPWAGDVELRVKSNRSLRATLKLRIPGYARDRPVPSDLYAYLDSGNALPVIHLNGKVLPCQVDADGYVTIRRKWKDGDLLSLQFPFPVRKVKAHPAVAEDRDKVALERGPLLYCAEWPDNAAGEVLNVIVDPDTGFEAARSDRLGGIVSLQGSARRARKLSDGNVTVSEPSQLTLIPYHLWNNRGPGEMAVWLPMTIDATRPAPAPTIASTSKVSASGSPRTVPAVNDQWLPDNSNDHKVPYLHWWPSKGTTQWVQYDFSGVKRVSKASVYWFDDGPHGGCRIPQRWEIQYRQGDQWLPVAAEGPYTVSKDDWDEVRFKPVRTTALRLVIRLPEDFSTGVHEWVVE